MGNNSANSIHPSDKLGTTPALGMIDSHKTGAITANDILISRSIGNIPALGMASPDNRETNLVKDISPSRNFINHSASNISAALELKSHPLT